MILAESVDDIKALIIAPHVKQQAIRKYKEELRSKA